MWYLGKKRQNIEYKQICYKCTRKVLIYRIHKELLKPKRQQQQKRA